MHGNPGIGRWPGGVLNIKKAVGKATLHSLQAALWFEQTRANAANPRSNGQAFVLASQRNPRVDQCEFVAAVQYSILRSATLHHHSHVLGETVARCYYANRTYGKVPDATLRAVKEGNTGTREDNQ